MTNDVSLMEAESSINLIQGIVVRTTNNGSMKRFSVIVIQMGVVSCLLNPLNEITSTRKHLPESIEDLGVRLDVG